MINPWQKQGVSIIPTKLEDLMPIVGQKRLFSELVDYRDECTGIKEGDHVVLPSPVRCCLDHRRLGEHFPAEYIII